MAEELVDRGWYSWEELETRREKREAKAHAAMARAEKARLTVETKVAIKQPKPTTRKVAKPSNARTVEIVDPTEADVVTA